MDNEINENNNKSNQDTFENPPKISFYKINILASVENANINENENENKENINKKKKTNNNKKNLLLLDPFSNKKTKKNLKNILESSFRSKRNSRREEDENKDNLKDNKLNIVVVNNNENENQIKLNEFNSPNLISPRKKNKEKNNDRELNLSKLAEKLYENEEHFQKNIIPKKGSLIDSLNTIKKNDSFISEEIIKKKLKSNFNINIDSNNKDHSNANLLKEFSDKHLDNIKRKSNASSSSKGKSSIYNIKKGIKTNNYSNFKKSKYKNEVEVEKKEDKEEDKISIRKRPKFSNNNIISNSKTLKLNISSKPLKLYNNKKSPKEETETKIDNTKKKSSNKIKNNKSQINDNTKNEKIKSKKKDKKFCYFCCLNNKDNDSDEYCN